MKARVTTQAITTYSVYVAIFLIFGLVPYFGYISIPPVKATLMAIPVALVTAHKKIPGAIFGIFMFGVTSILSAVIYGSVFLSHPYSWGYAFLFLFIGRILILIFLIPTILIMEKYFENIIWLKNLTYGFVIAIFNTLIIIFLIYIVGSGVVKMDNKNHGYWAFIALIGKNIAIEWTLPPFVSMSLASVVNKVIAREKVIKSAKW